jgi:hypothetical protein
MTKQKVMRIFLFSLAEKRGCLPVFSPILGYLSLFPPVVRPAPFPVPFPLFMRSGSRCSFFHAQNFSSLLLAKKREDFYKLPNKQKNKYIHLSIIRNTIEAQ